MKLLTDLMTFVDILLYISYSLPGCGLLTTYQTTTYLLTYLLT